MKRRSQRYLSVPVLAVAGVLASLAAGSCAGDADEATVRSLERTGKVAFVCLGAPGSDAALRALSDCSNERRQNPIDFGNAGEAGHIYALVTLETRGELAVVDVTARESNVLDQDPSTPGDNPLPIGAQPVDVVATPKGTAAFVASAENGRPALYALDAQILRPCEVDSVRCDQPPPTLSSYPSCRLPSPPGAMVLVADPPDEEGNVRRGCGGAYEPVEAGAVFGDIDREGLGRQKLYVTLPRDGRVVVVDAQELLSQPAGAFEDCAIEAELALSTTVPAAPLPPPIVSRPECAVPEEAEPRPTELSRSVPAGVALDAPVGGTPGASGASLYLSDLGLPVIHVLDLSDPCAPIESSPLLPTSAEDPSRVVLTSKVAVSRLTPSGHRYVYATDVEDRSVMAFDVTPGTGSTQPLVTAHPEYDPSQPPDRVRFAAAPVDITIIQRDVPEENDSGIAPIGTVCDPTCTGCFGSLYRTSSDFETGAGPFTLRGVFAMVALASGQIATIDIEDFDAPCRGPQNQTPQAGCDGTETGLNTSGEATCNAVEPHQPRSAFYVLTNEEAGRHQPGIQSFPVLSLEDGSVTTDGPALRAPLGSSGQQLAVGNDLFEVPPSGAIQDDEGLRNTLLLTLENPRVHQADQEWALTYQGELPGFETHVGDLRLSDGTFSDPTASFCARGVQSEAAVRLQLEAEGDLSGGELDAAAARLADRLFVAEPLAAVEDPYWSNASCSFAECRSTFGDSTVPRTTRDLRILEAREDGLEIAPPDGATVELTECCFPTLVDYDVRAGDEWVLVGGASGFLHNVIAEPGTGVCRPSCDPTLARNVGRARYTVAPTDAVPEGATVFENALFRFSVLVPPVIPPATEETLERDMRFRFITQASFTPMRTSLLSDSRRNVQIQSLGYLPITDELFVTEGGLEGLLLVPARLAGDLRQFF